MKTYTIAKKRDGQQFKFEGEIMADSFEQAKKDFAEQCYNDLKNGVHGDDYCEEWDESIEELKKEGVDTSWYDGRGVYLDGEMVMPYSEVENGIDQFSEDVYTWKLIKA